MGCGIKQEVRVRGRFQSFWLQVEDHVLGATLSASHAAGHPVQCLDGEASRNLSRLSLSRVRMRALGCEGFSAILPRYSFFLQISTGAQSDRDFSKARTSSWAVAIFVIPLAYSERAQNEGNPAKRKAYKSLYHKLLKTLTNLRSRHTQIGILEASSPSINPNTHIP